MRDIKLIYENLVLKIYALVNGLILLFLLSLIYKSLKISYIMLLGILLFTVIILINIQFPTPMYYFAILNVYIMFYIYTKLSINFILSKVNILILIVYIVSPILIVVFFPSIELIIPPLFVFESFRGFTFDRIEYALLVGYLILILIIENKYLYLLPILAYGLLIAESRAVILSLFISIIFFNKKNYKNILIIIFIGIFFSLLYFYLSNRGDISTDGGRIEFYIDALAQIFKNPKSLFFGSGKFYTPVDTFSVVPHNWFFQNLLNFGIIGTFIWGIFILLLFFKLNNKGRIFIIYGLVLGFFQPGYDAFMFLPFSAFGYYLAIIYGRSQV